MDTQLLEHDQGVVTPAHIEVIPPDHTIPFDYDRIENEADRDFARHAELRICGIRESSSRDIGKLLIAVKGRPGMHGHWGDWLRAQSISDASAARYMQDARAFTDDEFFTVKNLPTDTRYRLAQVEDDATRGEIIDNFASGAIDRTALKEQVETARANQRGPRTPNRKAINADNALDRKRREQKVKEIVAALGAHQLDKLCIFYNVMSPADFGKALKAALDASSKPDAKHAFAVANYLYERLGSPNIATFLKLMGEIGHEWTAVRVELDKLCGPVRVAAE